MDVLTLFANSAVRDIGATALVGLIVVMILTGRLVPKSAADAWKDAYYKEKESSQEKDQQITLLARSTVVSARVLDALPLATGGGPDAEETSSEDRRR